MIVYIFPLLEVLRLAQPLFPFICCYVIVFMYLCLQRLFVLLITNDFSRLQIYGKKLEVPNFYLFNILRFLWWIEILGFTLYRNKQILCA